MRAMILAAGRGKRMQPLTNLTPKPLLKVAGKPLIEHIIEKLVGAGVTDIVINHAWLGDQIEAYLGDGSRWGVRLHYSPEPEGGLETAGGIIKALPLLGDNPFWVVNGDIFIESDLAELPTELESDDWAHLLFVQNPAHNPLGDFVLENGRVNARASEKAGYTFAGIGLYTPELFASYAAGFRPLKPLLLDAIASNKVAGSLLKGHWTDVGTPARLSQLNQQVEDTQ
ncbi:MurNAc alpha-1-phosphate uridylyltransferase [Idiomarina fontislapidosi]|uniref:Mannose-1-phosphate guanylyltransferase n=1 Tax=Idiomarina fontislapidosi TaxID=263723 RepID=A0A432Y858_9GAMM|nr:nucleotidyltransferase family protein [Idiomarina fontislapidosi]PYE33761.1 MurNAc alpha-1-phosphate uridylyltransferase [Idiomarina fontislapidosi]RUO57160.1 mannose-1-phosphate guanylyltransferase [Idiomarina fontislapidosi]